MFRTPPRNVDETTEEGDDRVDLERGEEGAVGGVVQNDPPPSYDDSQRREMGAIARNWRQELLGLPNARSTTLNVQTEEPVEQDRRGPRRSILGDFFENVTTRRGGSRNRSEGDELQRNDGNMSQHNNSGNESRRNRFIQLYLPLSL